MVLVIFGILGIALGFSSFWETSEGCAFSILCGFFMIIFGLFVPIEGYEDPILIGEQKLYPLSIISEYEENDKETYLITEIKDGSSVYYTYCTEVNGIADTETICNVKKVLYIENEQPTIEEYLSKATRIWFTLAIGFDKKEYIIKVPKDGIELRFNN